MSGVPYVFSSGSGAWQPPRVAESGGVVASPPPTTVTITAERLTPDVLLTLAEEAAQQLRQIRGPEDRDAWYRTTGRELGYQIRSVWQGKITDLYLATLANVYLHVAAQPFLTVMPTLAEMTGRSANTVKMHLVKARDRGLLVGESGRAGGTLTDKAQALLDEHLENTHPYG